MASSVKATGNPSNIITIKMDSIRIATSGLVMLYRTRFLGHKFVSCGGPE